MNDWLAANWPWIIFTLLPAVGLAALSFFPLETKSKKWFWGRLALVVVLALSLAYSSFVDSNSNAKNLDRIVNGLLAEGEQLKQQSANLTQQSNDLKLVGGDLKNTMQIAASEVLVTRLNLAAVMDLQFQIASQNEIDAEYATLLGNIDWQFHAADLQNDDMTLRADRIFRDTAFATPLEFKAFNDALVANLRLLIQTSENMEKARQLIATNIESQKIKLGIRGESIDAVLATISAPVNHALLENKLDEFKNPPVNANELRDRAAVYSDLVLSLKSFSNQLGAATRQINLASKAAMLKQNREKIEQERADMIKMFGQSLPANSSQSGK